jgi:uncharacterized membrane protein
MPLRRLRAGELLALLGAACVIVSLLLPWYSGSARGTVGAWDTFGAAVVLLIAAAVGALATAATALTERSTALPVGVIVWSVTLGAAGIVAALVRVLERPDHATSLCAGAWVSLAGALAIMAGAWLALKDERTALYEPAEPPPRPRP